MTMEREIQDLSAVVERLAMKFPEQARPDIESVVAEEHSKLDEGRIRDFVPLLVERAAKARLRG
jgi:hypothetical protein